MKQELDLYIKNNLEKNSIFKSFFKQKRSSEILEDRCISYEASQCMGSSNEINVHNFININKDDNNFQKLLFNFIDSKGLKDSDVYNKVHIDRRLFSKIRSDSNYHPSKETILLLGFSLELSEDEIDSLLEVIKPVLLLCAMDVKKNWLSYINTNVKHCQKGIDAYDAEIKELQKKRLHYVEKYNLFKEAFDSLQQNNQEELENKMKK